MTSSTAHRSGDPRDHSRGFLLRRAVPSPYERLRSHQLSTGVSPLRQPGGEDISRSVDVTIMNGFAFACPRPRAQGQGFPRPATGRTPLRRWLPATDDEYAASVPVCLVLQHAAHLPPRSVRDSACQSVVAFHVPDAEILDHDCLVLADESSGQLVEMVATSVRDPGLDSRQRKASLQLVGGTVLFSRETALGMTQSSPLAAFMAWVGDLLSGGKGCQGGQPQVHTDGLIRCWKWLQGRVFDQQRDEPPSSTVARHCDGRGLGSSRQRTRPHNVQRLLHLRQGQISVPPTKRGAGVLGGGSRPALGLEARVLSLLPQEGAEGGLQVAKRLLKGDRRNLVEKGQVRPLPLGECGGSLGVTHRPAVGSPTANALFEWGGS